MEHIKGLAMLNKIFFVSIFMIFSLLGCAASGTNDGSFPSAKEPSTSPNARQAQKVCNAGEILHCVTRSPHRISDGRYGRNNRKSQRCMCVPESDLESLERSVITGPQ